MPANGDSQHIPEDVWGAFRHSELWQSVDDDTLVDLIGACRLAEFEKGDFLFAEGEPADEFCVVVEGNVFASHSTPDGRTVIFAIGGPSDVVGMTGLGGADRCLDFVAGEPTRAAFVPVDAARTLMSRHNALALAYVEHLAESMAAILATTKAMSVSVASRLAHFVASLPRTHEAENEYTVTLPTNRVDLAAVLGTVPETLSRTFRSLARSGVLTAAGRTVRVIDAQRLAEFASDAE